MKPVDYARLGMRFVYLGVTNTIRAGWDAPRRWTGLLLYGKPYWRYLPKDGRKL